jgi:hypothetical protein
VRSLRFNKDTNSSQDMNSLLWFYINKFICLLLVIVESFSYQLIYNSFNFVQVLGIGNHKNVMLTRTGDIIW